MKPDTLAKKQMVLDVLEFASRGSGLWLRGYQAEVAQAIVRSVMEKLGLSMVVIFPRQSGKNELQAQLEAYLLLLFSQSSLEMVKVAPTWKPQSLHAMRRLEQALKANKLTCKEWRKEAGYMYRFGQARITFLAGSPTANVVGATASLLLACDEAQDVQIAKWDRDFAPMASSTNATSVFWGTAWTAQTLLARELRLAREAERQDGLRRVFVLGAEEVAREVPAYGAYVAKQVSRLGRQHPMVRSQYFSEEIEATGGMFPERRLALMQGYHERCAGPAKDARGRYYAMLIDVAGEDEKASEQYTVYSEQLANPQRDSTALTVVEVDLGTLADELLRLPTYRVVDRRLWTGVRHADLYGKLRALVEVWQPVYLVIDATGVGAGLASFLEKALTGRSTQVLPFIFNRASKSKLGWDFLAVVETGRFRNWKTANCMGQDDEQAGFERQCRACEMDVLPGPERWMRWGVPETARDPATGELIHDDLLISAALCAVLDGQSWVTSGPPLIIKRMDPLQEMDQEGF